MTGKRYITLPERGLLKIEGEDARSFLQGIITNDIHKVAVDNAIYACLLTPQGKYLFDFFIAEHEGALFLDCDRHRIGELEKRLLMYKLRAKAQISNVTDKYMIFVRLGDDIFDNRFIREAGRLQPITGGAIYIDPRHAGLYARGFVRYDAQSDFLAQEGCGEGVLEEYEILRISLCVPDSRDLIPDKSFPLQFRMEELHAIDYRKGCYVGQEVTARTHHRGVVRKTLYRVASKNPLPEAGTAIRYNDRTIGEIRYGNGNQALALLEIEAVTEAQTTDSASALFATETGTALHVYTT